MSEDALASLRGSKVGFVFQSFHLVPRLRRLENVSLLWRSRGARDATRRARRSWKTRG